MGTRHMSVRQQTGGRRLHSQSFGYPCAAPVDLATRRGRAWYVGPDTRQAHSDLSECALLVAR